jgi:hypothetical protein
MGETKEPRSKAQRILLFGLGLLAVALVLFGGFVLNKYRMQRIRERGYQQIKVDDSKERVSSLMGQPDEVETCRTVSSSKDTAEDREYQRNCFEQYWYYSLVSPYVISFDKDGRVISKAYQISP